MKFKKLVFLFLVVSLNLYGFEPMMPSESTNKAIENFEQIEDKFFTGDDHSFNDYGTKILPSFNCSDKKGKYKFKEVFEDTLKYVPILYSFRDLKDIKKTDKNPYAEFLRKYDNYTGDYDDYRIHDLLYIVLIQYSLIDKNGHLVLPENRKEE